MKVNFDRETFLAALVLAAATEDPRAQGLLRIPALGASFVRTRSLRSAIGTEVAINLDVKEAGELHTNIAKLGAMLAASSAKEGSLSVEGDKATLLLGRSKFKVLIGDANYTAPLDFPAPIGAFELPAAGFLKAIARVTPAIDPARGDALAGAYLYIEEGASRMVVVGATGAHLIEASCPLAAPAVRAANAVIPVSALAQFTKATTTTGNVKLDFCGAVVTYETGAVKILSPVLISEYVDYKRIIPPERKDVYAIVLAADLSGVLHRVDVADEEKAGVRISLGEKMVQFHLGQGDVEVFSDSVEADAAGKDEVWCQPADLKMIVSEAGKGDKVRIEFNGPTTCVRASIEGDASYLALAMPMDLNRLAKAAA